MERAGKSDIINVGSAERVGSALAGGALAIYGVLRGSLGGWALAALGGALAYRGLTGHCHVYEAIGIDRVTPPAGTVIGNLGVKIDRAVDVQATPALCYAVWRNLENLPRFMSHVESVRVETPTHSRWRVRAPAGTTVEWEADIINERPHQLIAWRTRDNAMVAHAGSVNFDPLSGGGTRVRVALQYDPPGGTFTHAVTALVGEDAGRRVEEDLRRFKEEVEAGRLAA